MLRAAILMAHCVQSAPLPSCGSFWLTEFGGGVRLASNRSDSRASLFGWSFGAMKNLTPRTGVGGAGFFTWSESAMTAGIAPRLRYWATPDISFDLAPGLIIVQGGSRNIGFHGQLAANFGPSMTLTTTVQVTNAGEFTPDGRQLRRIEWYAGGRLGGKAGVVVGIAAPILTFLGYVLIYSGRSD